jgi:integrase
MMKTERFPVTVSEEGVSAKIRKSSRIKKGKTYTSFTAEYFLLGKRKQESRSSFDEAKSAAVNACRQISRGQQVSLTLANGDRLEYLRANEAVTPIGIKLDVAAHEYAAAVGILPPGTTLKEAVQFFRSRSPAVLENRSVRKVANEMLAVKRAAKLSDVHLKDLESRLNRFSDDFQVDIGNLSSAMIQAWLDAMNVVGRTKQNYLRVIGALFRFAVSRKYLPKDSVEEIESVQAPKVDSGEVEIFTPEYMREILTAARPEMIPFLAIGAFAGLRSAEIVRLDWQEINLKESYIEIKASKAKTGARRLVPITDNLAKWLAPYAKKSGSIISFKSWWNQIPKTVEAVNKNRGQTESKPFVWKHNALRHSFCSYRVAAIKNVAQVALEAGNSAQMIFQHYRQLVSEGNAAEWFGIMPPRA